MMMPTATETAMRQEKDSIGIREVPAEAYYGIQALRGSENFPITGIKPAQQYPEAIWAFAQMLIRQPLSKLIALIKINGKTIILNQNLKNYIRFSNKKTRRTKFT